MTIRNLIDYLKSLPEETEVYVVVVKNGGYLGDYGQAEPIEIDKNTELIDLRDNRFAKGTPNENKVCLYLGET